MPDTSLYYENIHNCHNLFLFVDFSVYGDAVQVLLVSWDAVHVFFIDPVLVGGG